MKAFSNIFKSTIKSVKDDNRILKLNALEVIELWIEDAQKAGDPIPQPSFAA